MGRLLRMLPPTRLIRQGSRNTTSELTRFGSYKLCCLPHGVCVLQQANPAHFSASCVCRITLPNLPAAMAAGRHTVADASSRMLAAERFGFELFTIHPDLNCKPYQYSWGTSCQVSSNFSEFIRITNQCIIAPLSCQSTVCMKCSQSLFLH